jgi:endoglucanase
VDPDKDADGGYDAVRVYLWLGMLADDAPGRAALIEHFKPVLAATVRQGHVPEYFDSATGTVRGSGPVVFSAALLPLLTTANDAEADMALISQRETIRQSAPLADGYYNQSLLMFGQGWDEQRYRFDKDGRLLPNWMSSCIK